MLRKTKAMDLYQQGIPMPIIMRLLGHEHVSTTAAFYAFATMDMMREAIDAATPATDPPPERLTDDKLIRVVHHSKSAGRGGGSGERAVYEIQVPPRLTSRIEDSLNQVSSVVGPECGIRSHGGRPDSGSAGNGKRSHS